MKNIFFNHFSGNTSNIFDTIGFLTISLFSNSITDISSILANFFLVFFNPEKSFLTAYQRTKCVIHSPAKKIPMCVGHFGIFETNKFPLIYTKSQNERSRIYLKLPRAKAQVLVKTQLIIFRQL